MKLFIDSADLDEIKKFYAWGIADGVTTNPSLMKLAVDARKKRGEKIDLKKYITEILRTARGTPVSLEVTETTAQGMLEQGKKLYKLFNRVAGNVCIKIPVNAALNAADANFSDGIKAIRTLAREKIPINCTLIFTPEQALLAAKAGAAFVSPFAGRIDDFIREQQHIKFAKDEYFPAAGMEKGKNILEDNGIYSGIDLVWRCHQILSHYKFKTQVLAASIRNPRQAREAALHGADIATLPFAVIKEMVKHAKSYEGMKKFTNDIVEEYVALTKG